MFAVFQVFTADHIVAHDTAAFTNTHHIGALLNVAVFKAPHILPQELHYLLALVTQRTLGLDHISKIKGINVILLGGIHQPLCGSVMTAIQPHDGHILGQSSVCGSILTKLQVALSIGQNCLIGLVGTDHRLCRINTANGVHDGGGLAQSIAFPAHDPRRTGQMGHNTITGAVDHDLTVNDSHAALCANNNANDLSLFHNGIHHRASQIKFNIFVIQPVHQLGLCSVHIMYKTSAVV